MTSEQAKKIVTAIFARWTKAHLSPAVLEAWAGSFVEFDFEFAGRHLKPVITTATGDHPPPLNVLRRLLVDRREQERPKEPDPPPVTTVDEALNRAAKTPTHLKYLAMIAYLRTNAETPRRKRGTPPRLGGRNRIEARLDERYGADWRFEHDWGMEGGSAYPLNGEEGERYRKERGR